MTDQPEYMTFYNYWVDYEEILHQRENEASERERPRLRDPFGQPVDGIVF